MKRVIALCMLLCLLVGTLAGCAGTKPPQKIGVSLGVGSAPRWAKEKTYMEERAAELGIPIEVRLNKGDEGKPQKDDCLELLDSGIGVLILRPKDTASMEEVFQRAAEKQVKIICYTSLVEQLPVDLFVGYDCENIGAVMGKHLTETVYSGDYIILSGAPEDQYVSPYLYQGAMEYIDDIGPNIRILLDAPIPGWEPEEAKRLVKEAVESNGNHINAILAPNDGIAGACAEALAELGVTTPVAITGMDADLQAIRRLVAGTQSCTVYMDNRQLANTAVEQAVRLLQGEPADINGEFENGGEASVPTHLITGKLVTRENLDRVLLDPGVYTHEEVYGPESGG